MRMVVCHLTRMHSGFICVAGIDTRSGRHVRPEISGSRLTRDLLVRQVLQPVQWETTMRGLLALGVEKFYEIGPQRVLAGLLKRVERKMQCVNIQA